MAINPLFHHEVYGIRKIETSRCNYKLNLDDMHIWVLIQLLHSHLPPLYHPCLWTSMVFNGLWNDKHNSLSDFKFERLHDRTIKT